MRRKKDLRGLYKALGYTFQTESLLISALTHRSVPQNNNERLEFLGDSIVNFIAAELVYTLFEHATEGELSRLRTLLVRGETLAQLARDLGIGEYLYLGMGELRSGGARRESILADALEAVIAAIYLDAGMDACKATVTTWFQTLVTHLLTHKIQKDPKTRLQEYLQSFGLGLPQYEVILIEGKAHAQLFTVQCTLIETQKKVSEKGASRRRAEQAAAESMLAELTKKVIPHDR